MLSLRFGTLALLLASALPALAQADTEELPKAEIRIDEPGSTPNLNIRISASFPQSEIFGVKLVNGHPTQALVNIENGEPEAIQLAIIGGALGTPEGVPGAPDPPQIIRNLTAIRYGSSIPAGESESFTYTFATDMHPQDLTLRLTAIVQSGNTYFTYPFYNQTVSVVEAPTSIFDPQIIFLYLILAAAFGGTCLFIYNTWITTLFPQKKGRGKGGERAKRSASGAKKVDPADQVSVIGADGPAVTSGAKAGFDQSWIPAHHLQRPEAKRVGSGKGPKPKTKVAPTSP